MAKKAKLIIIAYLILFLLFALWTWILTAPNLVLTSWAPYWHYQTFLWDNFYPNRNLITTTYLILISLLFLTFIFLRRFFVASSLKKNLVIILLFSIPLLFSFNALSFDVFNYLFNAKMLAVYHADPHLQVALDFPEDTWTRFMHNTHTPAPYGYGWTLISLLPFLITGGKFTLTWFTFRLLNLLLLFTLAFIFWRWSKKLSPSSRLTNFSLFFFNPLVLIEVITNIHNDLWMMLGAVLSLFLLYPRPRKLSPLRLIISFLCLLFSFSIKYATIVLLPVWLFLIIKPPHNFLPQIRSLLQKWQVNLFDLCAVLLFLPLLIPRSQLFHPWYLIWSLTFLPLGQNKIIRSLLLIFTLTSLLRYAPYLQANGYDTHTLLFQQFITFLPVIFYLVSLLISRYNKHTHVKTI
jgi:hypothetical protein